MKDTGLNVRRIAYDLIGPSGVSTIHSTLALNFGEEPPLYYETMVFGGPLDGYRFRCGTETEALVAHAHIVEKVRGRGYTL